MTKKAKPDQSFWHKHDAEIAILCLYLITKTAAAFTNPDMHFWYATLHGHSDDLFGAFVVIAAAKYAYEKISD